MILDKYVKYLSAAQPEENWDISLSVAGFTKIPAGVSYPPSIDNHPSSHLFSWEKGRTLEEFQLVYITRGKGVFQSDNTKETQLSEGSLLLLSPKVWHRYKCLQETGWDEYYIGFSGILAEKFFQQYFIPQVDIFHIGYQETVLKFFLNIIEVIEAEKPGYQFEASGAVVYLLGKLFSIIKSKDFEGTAINDSIQKARILMIQNYNKELDMRLLASELHVGYSWFRKKFKEYTGMSPGQYHLQLRINKSKEYLLGTSDAIKHIAFAMGFESAFYFSRIFKSKTGMSPAQFRKFNT